MEVAPSSVSTRPDLLSLCKSGNLLSDLARCLVLTALLRSHQVADHVLIVRPWDGGPEVRVQAFIKPDAFVHYRSDIGPIPVPPEAFEGSVMVCHSFRQLLEAIDENALLESALLYGADRPADVELAVRIKLGQSRLSRGLDDGWDNPLRFSLGKNFCASATKCLATNRESLIKRTLETIVEAIEGSHQGQPYSLRVTSSGSAP